MNRPTSSFACLFALIITVVPCAARADVERVQVVSTPDKGEVPDAEIDSSGTIHLAYVVGEDALYVKSCDDGKTFSQPLRVNSDPGTVHPPHSYRGPDLAISKGGRVHVIWYGNGYQRKLPKEQWGVFYSHLDPGDTAFAASRNLNHKPSDNYSLATDHEGNVAVVWMAGGLSLTSSQDNGDTFALAETVSIADPCECCASRAFFSADSTLSIAYREKARNLRDMYVLERAKGQPAFSSQKISSTPWEVNACPMTGTFLSGTKQGRVVGLETKGQISYARLGPTRSLAPPSEIKAGAKGKWPVALAAPDGTVLVSWKNGSTLYWQLRDSKDKPIGDVESAPGRNPHRHAGVVTKDGNFLLFD
jgi:hypothetical protein